MYIGVGWGHSSTSRLPGQLARFVDQAGRRRILELEGGGGELVDARDNQTFPRLRWFPVRGVPCTKVR